MWIVVKTEDSDGSCLASLMTFYGGRVGACMWQAMQLRDRALADKVPCLITNATNKIRPKLSCWKSRWMRVFVKVMMGWEDLVSLPTDLCLHLPFSLILCCAGQAAQSLEAYMQYRKGASGNVKPRVPGLLILCPTHDRLTTPTSLGPS